MASKIIFTVDKDNQLIALVREKLYESNKPMTPIQTMRAWSFISKRTKINVKDLQERWEFLKNNYLKNKRNNVSNCYLEEYMDFVLPQFKEKPKQQANRSTKTDTDVIDIKQEYSDIIIIDDIKVEDTIISKPEPSTSNTEYYPNADSKEEEASPSSSKPSKKAKLSDERPSSKTGERKRRKEYDISMIESDVTHKFFDCMADIVCKFPPELITEARLSICEIVCAME